MELASLAQLARSHRRHDEVMAGLLSAARRLAAGRPGNGDLAAVREAAAFFEDMVRRHFLDEEGSVFPRLSTRRPEVAEALAALSAEHPPQVALQAEIVAIARDLDGASRPVTGKHLLEAAEQLAELHGSHVRREDELFARAHEALTAEDDAEILAEMEMRRDRDEPAQPTLKLPRQKAAKPVKKAKPAANKAAKAAKAVKRPAKKAAKPATKNKRAPMRAKPKTKSKRR